MSYKPLQPKEGEPRQPNEAYSGLFGTTWAGEALLVGVGSLAKASLAYVILLGGPQSFPARSYFKAA